MRVFFDSSAFVKRYVREDGSDAVLDWCERADVLLLCVPYTLDKDVIFATDKFEKGDLVVRISYYKLAATVEGGFRKYWLMDGKKQERMIHVSSLIRIQGLMFSPGPGGPAGRVNRREIVKMYYLI